MGTARKAHRDRTMSRGRAADVSATVDVEDGSLVAMPGHDPLPAYGPIVYGKILHAETPQPSKAGRHSEESTSAASEGAFVAPRSAANVATDDHRHPAGSPTWPHAELSPPDSRNCWAASQCSDLSLSWCADLPSSSVTGHRHALICEGLTARATVISFAEDPHDSAIPLRCGRTLGRAFLPGDSHSTLRKLHIAGLGSTATMTGDGDGDTLTITEVGRSVPSQSLSAIPGSTARSISTPPWRGDQTIDAATGSININAGDGNDMIALGAGVNLRGTIDGGDDLDTLDYSTFATAASANLGLNTAGLSATLGARSGKAADHARWHRHGDRQQLQHRHAHLRHHASPCRASRPPSVTGFHIHQAAVGVNGPIIVDFTGLAAGRRRRPASRSRHRPDAPGRQRGGLPGRRHLRQRPHARGFPAGPFAASSFPRPTSTCRRRGHRHDRHRRHRER